jgi:hypothetical protein
MYTPFEDIAASSRLWIYQSDRAFTASEQNELGHMLQQFCEVWQVHGQGLETSYTIKYDRFILLVADESKLKASGCSIDSSVRLIKDIESKFQVNLFDRLNIAYKKEGALNACNVNEFRTGLQNGDFSDQTIVFNNMVESKSDLVSKWEVPVKESWHKQLLPQ